MTKLVTPQADEEVQHCLNERLSFSVVAGAGSGKTASLINALKFLRDNHGRALKRDGQRIACITYTNRAVDVISSRLEWNSLFLVSTLHAFLWGEIKNFVPNIRHTLEEHIIPAQIKRRSEEDDGGDSQRAIKARQRLDTLKADLDALKRVESFDYNDSSYRDYSNGQLDHDDVIAIAAHLISTNNILQRIIGQKYPYLFVDEAQDTFHSIVEALNALCAKPGLPLVGYFGDPMQQIYDDRAGGFAGPTGSVQITKQENFRCAREIVALLNAFRTDVIQHSAGESEEVEGTVQIVLARSEKPTGQRNRYSDEQLQRSSQRFLQVIRQWGWEGNGAAKHLFLARQMIARRMGFLELQRLFVGDFASSRAQNEYENGTHFLLAPFVVSVVPLVKAFRSSNSGELLDVLRRSSPAFDPRGVNATKSLREMKSRADAVVEGIVQQWDKGSLGDILRFCIKHDLCKYSERLRDHLERSPRTEEYDPDKHAVEKADWLADAFFLMGTAEIEPFVDFVSESTPFSTQHGVKGEEYKDVVVVFDDVEAAWQHYSFTKLLTPNTSGKPTDGQSDRSRRLAYVCFSRAKENLRILLFTSKPEHARDELVRGRLFRADQVTIFG